MIEERAALWVLRQEEPSWTPADQAEFDEWLAESDAHKVAFWRLECGWREADRIAALGTPPEPVEQRFAPSSWWKPLAIAASVLVAFTIFLVQLPSFQSDGTQQASMRFETPVGGHRVVKLPDGSRVELNTDTVVKAVVNEGQRAVWLERGEAFFDIAKQPGQAFVIYAGARTITVLGTKFSVRRTPREIVVAVLEGRVRVDEKAGAGPDRHATVTAGDVAFARDRSTLVANSAEAVSQQLAWRNGLLQFDGATLADAAAQFNRYNHKQLVIGDPEAARILVAGSFLARNVDAFARLVERAYGVDAQNRSDRIFLSARRLAYNAPVMPARPEMIATRPRTVPEAAAPQCGPGGADCSPIALPQAPAPVATAEASEDQALRALREAKNWEVLHKLYPPRALAAREEGVVGFTVKIDGTGNPTSCKITRTSGHPLLDLETCQLIMVHATFKRPTGISRSQERSYEGVVNWRVPPTATVAAAPAPKAVAQASPPEELICKRIPQTGSNAAFQRKCMRRSEWQRVSRDNREPWDQQPNLGRRCEGHPTHC
jgi:transmembrane sensor